MTKQPCLISGLTPQVLMLIPRSAWRREKGEKRPNDTRNHRQTPFPDSSHFLDPNCDNIQRTDQKDTFFATERIFRLPPSFSLGLIALPNFGAWNALSSVVVVVVEIFMVQLVKSRISSCKTTCSRGQTETGGVCQGGGEICR